MVKEYPCYWEPITSTIDWCEGNCVYSQYVAELYNSLSSFFILFVSVVGYVNAVQQGLERRFRIMFFSQAIVAIGSVLFHATLSNSAQFLDEAPMILNGFMYLYAVVELEHLERKYHFLPTAITLSTIVVSLSIYYQFAPLFFQVVCFC